MGPPEYLEPLPRGREPADEAALLSSHNSLYSLLRRHRHRHANRHRISITSAGAYLPLLELHFPRLARSRSAAAAPHRTRLSRL